MADANKTNNKITSIEGLRTLGWIGIFLCHFRRAFLPGRDWWIDHTPLRFLYAGNEIVRLLFVISGFVLCYKYFTKEEYEKAPKDMAKRYLRLMPPILVANLIVCGLMAAGALGNGQVAEITGSQDFLGHFNQFTPSFLGCLKESLFSTFIFGSSGYIAPLWSIVYEYLGALMVLAIIFALRKPVWRFMVYAAFLIVLSSYYNYFIIGMLVCDIYTHYDIKEILKKYPIIHAILTILGYGMMSMVNIDDSNKLTRVIFGVGLFLFFLGFLCSDLCEKLLGGKIMVAGGKIAYCAYIVHWPIIESFSCGVFLCLYKKVASYQLLVTGICGATFLMIILLAWLMHRFVEPVGGKIVIPQS